MRVTDEIVVTGTARSPGIVLAPPRPSGRPNEAWEAFHGLETKEQKKLGPLLERLADPGEIRNQDDFKWLKGAVVRSKGQSADGAKANRIFEVKTHGVRLYGFHHDELGRSRRQKVYCLVTAGKKQSTRARAENRADYERAVVLRDELLASEG